MLEYDRINMSERNSGDKTKELRRCIIFNRSYFLK